MGNKIYVGNLPYSVTFDKLKELFQEFGDIEEATVITDKYSGRSKGFGFVTFKDDASVEKAVADMNGKEIDGREIKVNEARPREGDDGDSAVAGKIGSEDAEEDADDESDDMKAAA
ncbi:MAG: RNA-binding protein [Nanoarchaeota archaeon]|nr:RNA-binding protein [Nanoarchaeota archaeon]